MAPWSRFIVGDMVFQIVTGVPDTLQEIWVAIDEVPIDY